MNGVNKTLYIPLYGKAYVSEKGIILHDEKAEDIWSKEGFMLRGKSKSKWLAYYMGMRARVFDNWVTEKIKKLDDTTVIHIGCGMDSRALRVGFENCSWYDVDFPEVIKERRRYYNDTDNYKMISGDVREDEWLSHITVTKNAIIVMEGVSMYLRPEELKNLINNLKNNFSHLHILMDCYTIFAAKASKYKNPINDVGVTEVYGIDDPTVLSEGTSISFVCEQEMTPLSLIDELCGMERRIFKKLYAGKIAKKMYRLYEYRTV